jgi:hypothetical protein
VVPVPENENNNGVLDIVGNQRVIYNSDQTILGYVSENGFIYDHERTLLGYVSQRGVVRDVNLHAVGYVNIKQYCFPYVAGRAAFFLLIKAEEV